MLSKGYRGKLGISSGREEGLWGYPPVKVEIAPTGDPLLRVYHGVLNLMQMSSSLTGIYIRHGAPDKQDEEYRSLELSITSLSLLCEQVFANLDNDDIDISTCIYTMLYRNFEQEFQELGMTCVYDLESAKLPLAQAAVFVLMANEIVRSITRKCKQLKKLLVMLKTDEKHIRLSVDTPECATCPIIRMIREEGSVTDRVIEILGRQLDGELTQFGPTSTCFEVNK